VKIVRLCDLRELKNIVDDENIDVKVKIVDINNIFIIPVDNIRFAKSFKYGNFNVEIEKRKFN